MNQRLSVTEREIGPIEASWIGRYGVAARDNNPLHRPEGGDPQLVQGMLLACIMEGFIVEAYPDQPIHEVSLRFLRPVLAGSRVIYSLRPGPPHLEGEVQLQRLRGTARVAGVLCLIADCLLLRSQ